MSNRASPELSQDLVRFSRAGDVFHYRWAARRCLQLIYPNASLERFFVEGSRDRHQAGEYVIDVSEYSRQDNRELASHFQLKHSTKRVDQPFQLSDLQDMIKGFAARFRDHTADTTGQRIAFALITNRPVAENVKLRFQALAKGNRVPQQFQQTLEKYSELNGDSLKEFCAVLELIDGEGNYVAQHHKLHTEIARITADQIDVFEADKIVSLIQSKVMPGTDGEVKREEILQRFGVTSDRELFPAPTDIESSPNHFHREQHGALVQAILTAPKPIIVHASGGVGKSVVALQLAQSLPNGSFGIVYDCFGSGKYRNRSEPRHSHRVACLQIANELAVQGLCEPLITGSSNDAWMRALLLRLKAAVAILRKVQHDAVLAVFIDAADNAEMAGEEFGESCFVHELLREDVPEGCRIIAFCRTERKDLLQPKSNLQQIKLKSFSETESLRHLRSRFPDATKNEGQEFHRLSSTNPRVQANALDLREVGVTVELVLASLGPSPTTVDQQIEKQLESAIDFVRDRLPAQHQDQIQAICRGLANLPPFIPIAVLAKAAEVEPDLISSFASDLGRPLYLSDYSVHFRDEPTETWFRQRFAASPDDVGQYAVRLKPLAEDIPYVASVLPTLLHQSGQYDELIQLSLSDESLPTNKPIDARNIRVYRLQFALKAALLRRRYKDAAKLAFRAGEETAGKERERTLLIENLDLIAPLQSPERVQELAFRRMLRGDWDGSENVYSASLLSYLNEFQGDSRSFQRCGGEWLKLYFEQREVKKKSDPHAHDDVLKIRDIGEMAATVLNLDGPEKAADFTAGWSPPSTIFDTTTFLVRRLIDGGDFASIEKFAGAGCNSPHIILAICNELTAVGRRPEVDKLKSCLDALINDPSICPIPERGGLNNHGENFQFAVLALAESCAASGLTKVDVLHMLEARFKTKISPYIVSWHALHELCTFLRLIAVKAVLEQNLKPDLQQWLPEEWLAEKLNNEQQQKKKEFQEVFANLFPWFLARAQIIVDPAMDLALLLQQAETQSQRSPRVGMQLGQQLLFEVARIRFDCWSFARPMVIAGKGFAESLLDGKYRLKFNDQLNAVRVAHRLAHFKDIRTPLEHACREIVQHSDADTPEELAGYYLRLARAVLITDPEDAASYFDCAIEAVSKFGDEVVDRWRALTAVAERTAEGAQSSPETAYRYIRCAELVGDSVVREKHWDRTEAIEVCFRLHAASGFAALSRWRDRHVGYFERLLPDLAQVAVGSGLVPPAAGWSLSVFTWEHSYLEFALTCVERELDKANKQFILDTAVRDLRLQGNLQNWQQLKDIAQRFSLRSTEIQEVLDFQSSQPGQENLKGLPSSSPREEKLSVTDWSALFNGLDLSSVSGLSEAKQRFQATPYPHLHDKFWSEIFDHVPENNIKRLLEGLLLSEKLDSFDVAEAIKNLPLRFRQKVSVRKHWPVLARGLGKRFAATCCVHWARKRLVDALGADPSNSKLICDGVVEGLASTNDLNGAGTLFGFCEVIASYVTPEEARDVLEFALERFELHMTDANADGAWSTVLEPPTSMEESLAGFLWSALGSPRAAERWQAAHSVRRLAATGCQLEIDALVCWLARDGVGAFGSPAYPFYNLHARLYLLIALARVALDHPDLLKAHAAIFEHHALKDEPHVLIQKYASRTALIIETAYPGTYLRETVTALKSVGISSFPMRKSERYLENTVQSPWHVRGEVDLTLDQFLAYDFDRYWYSDLEKVFGVQQGQVETLARDLIFKKWKVESNDRSIHDPRRGLWKGSYSESETRHSHSDYPRADDYSFYLSYHSLLQIAALMLCEVPVVDNNYDENAWASWLQQHDLTRADGRWLADRRDPPPLKRPDWLRKAVTDTWRDEAGVDEADFTEELLLNRNGESWLCIDGYWEDGDRDRNETVRVATALVSPPTAQALLNALGTCLNPHDFKLPDLDEDRMEFNAPPFELRGWTRRFDISKGLDDFDPCAGNIPYPPFVVDSTLLNRFGLIADQEQRVWTASDGIEVVLCELWGEYKKRNSHDQEIRERDGARMHASLTFLKTLCQTLDRLLIIEVQIQRTYAESSYHRRKGSDEYRPPASRVYLLSADGKLRTTTTSHQLGESIGEGAKT